MRCPGFRFAAASAGIKNKAGALDVGLIVADQAAACAAVFTQNQIKAAPVRVSRAALRRSGGVARAVVVNSGNANACTGTRGVADARWTTTHTAATLGVPRGQVLVASTGVIGVPLPMERLERGVTAAAGQLAADRFTSFAQAILTTDRATKTARRRLDIGGSRVTLIGCTKGAGMIAPNMATTLTFVLTDVRIPPAALHRALDRACARTYNAISVDGDQSTNDMILVMASGRAKQRGGTAAFEAALTDLLDDLSRQLMRGGEGVHHLVEVRVRSARSQAAAAQVARAIAESPLVKTAIAGGDPNWGRILMAAGNAGVKLDPRRLRLWFDKVQMVDQGTVCRGRNLEGRVAAVMQRGEYTITLDLGAGRASAHCLTCDLSHEYVTINADYRT